MDAERIKGALLDLGKAALIGLCAAAVLGLVSFVVGFYAEGFAVLGGIAAARACLLVAGALLLFVSAGFLIAHLKVSELERSAKWKEWFKVLGLAPVAIVVAVAVLLVAVTLDALLFM